MFRHSSLPTIPTFQPIPTILMVFYADGAFPPFWPFSPFCPFLWCTTRAAHYHLLTGSPNALSLTCPPDVKPGQAPPNTRIRSDTTGLGSDRSKLDTGLRSAEGSEILLPARGRSNPKGLLEYVPVVTTDPKA